MMDRPNAWTVPATAINVGWSLLFWYVFFVEISWNVLEIPMGLGGAVYPAIFLGPVILGSVAYQSLLALLRRRRAFTRRQVLFWSLGVPCVLIAFLLILLCPMDSHDSYLGHVWNRLT